MVKSIESEIDSLSVKTEENNKNGKTNGTSKSKLEGLEEKPEPTTTTPLIQTDQNSLSKLKVDEKKETAMITKKPVEQENKVEMEKPKPVEPGKDKDKDKNNTNTNKNEIVQEVKEKEKVKVKPIAPPKPAKKPILSKVLSPISSKNMNGKSSEKESPALLASPDGDLDMETEMEMGMGLEDDTNLKLYPNRNTPIIVSSSNNNNSHRINGRVSSPDPSGTSSLRHGIFSHGEPGIDTPSSTLNRSSINTPTPVIIPNLNVSHIAQYYNANGGHSIDPSTGSIVSPSRLKSPYQHQHQHPPQSPHGSVVYAYPHQNSHIVHPLLHSNNSSRPGSSMSSMMIMGSQINKINNHNHSLNRNSGNGHSFQAIANPNGNTNSPASLNQLTLQNTNNGNSTNNRRAVHYHNNSQAPNTVTSTTSTTTPASSTVNRRHGDYQRLHRVGLLRGKAHTDSYKVIAFICGFFAAILLVMGLASSEWLIASKYRQGLFVYCVEKNETESSVPFVQDPSRATEGCHRIDLNMQGYTLVAAAFCVVSLLVDVFATLLTVLGLRCRDPTKKYKYYRIAVYVMALALVTVLVALVVYPVCFAQIMDKSHKPFWEFGWAYGVGWGASIFLFGGVILLLCDKESEEIYYKERTIVQYADNTNNKV